MATTTTLATSSTASFDGDYSFVHVSAEGGWADCWGKPPKTRKRITKEQLDMLEDLFRTNSHPSREERQTIAVRTGMELRSVTIWLQNKRQLIKKNASKGSPSGTPAPSVPSRPSTPSVSAGNPSDAARSRTLTPPAPCGTDNKPTIKLEERPSLECVASLSEYPTPSRDTTIKTEHEAQQPIWKHMPSSPLASPPRSVSSRLPTRSRDSSLALRKVSGRPYPAPLTRTTSVDSAVTSVSAPSSRRNRETERASYLKPGYTLEWACAQATKRQVKEELGEEKAVKVKMEEETDSASSAMCSVSSPVSDTTSSLSEPRSKPTEDEMQAALALCGMLQWCP